MLVVLLAMLVLLVFVMPLLPLDETARIAVDLFFSLVLLSGIATLSRTVWGWRVGTTVATVALLVRLADRLVPGLTLSKWDALLTLAAEGFLAAVLAAQLFREAGHVTIYRVGGAVVVYLLLGQMWVNAYWFIELLHPGAFHFQTAPAVATDTFGRLVYFSFATLSTVGYGDVLPLRPVARSLANLEALTGQLYPAILIARLVAMEIDSRRDRRAGDRKSHLSERGLDTSKEE
ncbi:MAG TPA: potassium channel family protein [Thermoanaerobaculia bacterium]|nr:potassium channel family protein [Thermoanaerobaculia bacterium]